MTDNKYIIRNHYKIKGVTNWKEMPDKKYRGHLIEHVLDLIAVEEDLAVNKKFKIKIKRSYWKKAGPVGMYYDNDIEMATFEYKRDYEYRREIVSKSKLIHVEKL